MRPDLPHAARVANRLNLLLSRQLPDCVGPRERPVVQAANALHDVLAPLFGTEDNPPQPSLQRLRSEAAAHGRLLAQAIADAGVGSDRIGQSIRNLFECLDLEDEGEAMGLLAGEKPASLMRPPAR